MSYPCYYSHYGYYATPEKTDYPTFRGVIFSVSFYHSKRAFLRGWGYNTRLYILYLYGVRGEGGLVV